jgi:LPS-assembly protein
MYKKLLFLLLNSLIFTLSLIAQEQAVRVMADNIETKGDVITAKGHVIMFSKEFILTSDEIVYDKKNSNVKANGNVELFRGALNQLKSQKIEFNIAKNSSKINNIFISDSNSCLWIDAKGAKHNQNIYTLENSIVSSCNIQNPDWYFSFKKGKYDSKKKYVTLRDTIFYLKDTPLAYLPYFAFSTIQKRASGLLRPKIGYDDDEGFLYAQPLYYAPYDFVDFIITPQVRSDRGVGLYIESRFVDSLYSSGRIKFGGFYDFNSYSDDYDLENQSHNGVEFTYNRNRLFSQNISPKWSDNLYLDITYLNDIDYLNLQTDASDSNDRMITSKFNYHINNDNNYFGLYA